MKNISISTKNAEYQIIQALKLKRVKRTQLGEVFVEGTESIKQAVKAGMEITRVIVHDEANLSDWGKHLIQSSQARVIEMTFGLYKELCDREDPSEMLITVKMPPAKLAELSLPEKPVVLIFDRPSDHGNFGSIVRSANSFDADALLVVGHGIDCYDPKTIRASLGSIFHTKIIHVQSMEELKDWIDKQKGENGLEVIGTDSSGGASLRDQLLSKPIALVLGNEAKGMSVALKSLCDRVVRIPISGAANSLNVACAGSIFLWEIYKAGKDHPATD
jgi:tRNA G18 (ribose-2'-O)-methylase SpoU